MNTSSWGAVFPSLVVVVVVVVTVLVVAMMGVFPFSSENGQGLHVTTLRHMTEKVLRASQAACE